ncbi:hypothetical protein NARC_10094 [Candidatus Nitrosocosmicus arcticus]|uniref:Uncharacterized protein n=1 Tax=Candidatus Nitrosocosmicus arcticus TaxID=2035267 RepID=A0A557SYL0_9ARCH|nr:hypothetical protein NARC_10094 [Candidatus Nitrosocosmicus arcticus]
MINRIDKSTAKNYPIANLNSERSANSVINYLVVNLEFPKGNSYR